jgi:S-adenosylmethionine:tRNA ribosyltransferase-isomerase
MRLSEFDYHLPSQLIAQEPAENRGSSRMLVVDPATESYRDSFFIEFPELLKSDDVLVLNNTKVFPARLVGRREPGGGRAEMFLVRRCEVEELQRLSLSGSDSRDQIWEVLVKPGRSLRVGARASFGGIIFAEVLFQLPSGRRIVRFEYEGQFDASVDKVGLTPLPPYIKRDFESRRDEDQERYQTVYSKQRGAIAAPTAGLHFTPEILQSIRDKAIRVVEITHHVGYGTFQPVRVDNIEDHHVESETYTIAPEVAETLTAAKRAGNRIVAAGTTTTRALESAVDESGIFKSGTHSTELFIYPGYRFKAIDCLLTNFHLPQSSLLMLVSALAGHDLIIKAYQHAVTERYRFYSYGDCMFISSTHSAY